MKMYCNKHGDTEFRNESKTNERWRCRTCLTAAFKERRQKAKRAAVDYLGGACSKCEYSTCIQALEFHHVDPTQKDFQLSGSFRSGTIDSVKSELDKCILLCSNCHRETHYELGL